VWPFPSASQNLGTQMSAANVTWRAYGEDMGTACNLSDSGNWATKHEPFLYFTDMQAMGVCATNNVDFATSFATDLAANTYRYMWITPNLLDDGHDPTTDPVTGLKQSDAWMQTVIPQIQASAGYKNGGVIFITWDEAEGRNGDDPDPVAEDQAGRHDVGDRVHAHELHRIDRGHARTAAAEDVDELEQLARVPQLVTAARAAPVFT
jgi:hypothetical protein